MSEKSAAAGNCLSLSLQMRNQTPFLKLQKVKVALKCTLTRIYALFASDIQVSLTLS